MANSQNQAEEADAKQQEPVPSSNEESTETNQSQEVAQETEVPSEAPAGDSDEELELPSGVRERTAEQFDKLKQQLREYRNELFQIKDQIPEKKSVEDKPLYDPKTGLVDIEALEQLRRDAREAKQELEGLKRLDRDREVMSLYDSYPELKDPKTKQDKEFFDEAEKIWLHSQANPDRYGGQPLNQKQAADLAKKRMSLDKPKESSNVEAKQEASAEASGKPTQAVSRQSSSEDLEKLRYGTRTGDKDSIVARMRMMREGSKASK